MIPFDGISINMLMTRYVIPALTFTSIAIPVKTMAGPRNGAVGLFVEVRTSVAVAQELSAE